MTAQEQQMLQGLTDRINGTQVAEKDPEAERYLAGTLGRNPDALYILAQTTLVQQYALEQAQKQLADARAQLEQLRQAPPAEPKHTGSFLGNLFGKEDAPARQAPPPSQSQYTPVPNYPPSGSFYAQGNQPQYSQPQYPPPPYAQPQFAQPQYAQPQPQSGGFLRSAMQTATGVAAGALAFEGIESLMHGFGGGHSGGGQGFGSFGGDGGAPREEIVNNYYGGSDPGERGEHSGHLSPDIEDRRGDAHGFADTGSDSDSDSDSDDSNDSNDSNTDSFTGSGDDSGDTGSSDDTSDSFDDSGSSNDDGSSF